MSEQGLDAGALLRRLRDAGVEYVVVGGFAVIAHGVQRFTKDLGICPAPEVANLARLATMLERANARQLGVGDFEPDEFPFDPTSPEELAEGGNFRLITQDGVLDVMQWIPGIEGEHAYPVLDEDAVEGLVFGIPVRVCSLARLREMKRAAARPQDRQDLADLDAAHPDDAG